MPKTTQNTQDNTENGRGFAGMDKEKQRDIASKGGQASYDQSSEEGSDESPTTGSMSDQR